MVQVKRLALTQDPRRQNPTMSTAIVGNILPDYSSSLLSRLVNRLGFERGVEFADTQILEPVIFQPLLQEDEQLLAEISTVGQRLNAEQEALRARGGGSSYALRNAAMEEIGMLQIRRERVIRRARNRQR